MRVRNGDDGRPSPMATFDAGGMLRRRKPQQRAAVCLRYGVCCNTFGVCVGRGGGGMEYVAFRCSMLLNFAVMNRTNEKKATGVYQSS